MGVIGMNDVVGAAGILMLPRLRGRRLSPSAAVALRERCAFGGVCILWFVSFGVMCCEPDIGSRASPWKRHLPGEGSARNIGFQPVSVLFVSDICLRWRG